MVAKEADERFQSMTEVIAALETCRGDSSGTESQLRPRMPTAAGSSVNWSEFLHTRDGDGASPTAATRAATKAGRRTKTDADEPTLVSQTDVRTERTLPPRVGKTTKGQPRRDSKPWWTDWRVLAGGG